MNGGAHESSRAGATLYDALTVHKGPYTSVKTHRSYNTAVNPIVDYGLWVMQR